MQTFTVVLSPNPDRGGYSVSVPAAPGALSQGASRDDALSNIKEALELWLEVTLERGGDLLAETPAVIAAEIESILQDRDDLGWDTTVETAHIAIEVPVAA